MLHIDPWKRLFGFDVWRANEVSFDLNKLLFQVGWKGEIFGEKGICSRSNRIWIHSLIRERIFQSRIGSTLIKFYRNFIEGNNSQNLANFSTQFLCTV